jgi:hypothetical protein
VFIFSPIAGGATIGCTLFVVIGGLGTSLLVYDPYSRNDTKDSPIDFSG